MAAKTPTPHRYYFRLNRQDGDSFTREVHHYGWRRAYTQVLKALAKTGKPRSGWRLVEMRETG